jgi:hypothetical protein
MHEDNEEGIEKIKIENIFVKTNNPNQTKPKRQNGTEPKNNITK